MKKHSGNVVCAGLLIGLFGLLVMGGVTAATSLFLQVPVDGVLGIVDGASELSTVMLVLGAVLLGFGLYMRTWSD